MSKVKGLGLGLGLGKSAHMDRDVQVLQQKVAKTGKTVTELEESVQFNEDIVDLKLRKALKQLSMT